MRRFFDSSTNKCNRSRSCEVKRMTYNFYMTLLLISYRRLLRGNFKT